jgi:biotin carboxyl carrier protein
VTVEWTTRRHAAGVHHHHAPLRPPRCAASSPVTSAPLSAPATAPAAAAVGPGDVPSPLAGRVTALNVEAGQDVNEGDHLLTLEAMKMNTFVMAPRAGKVREVKVSVGSAVDEGQALVTLE